MAMLTKDHVKEIMNNVKDDFKVRVYTQIGDDNYIAIDAIDKNQDVWHLFDIKDYGDYETKEEEKEILKDMKKIAKLLQTEIFRKCNYKPEIVFQTT